MNYTQVPCFPTQFPPHMLYFNPSIPLNIVVAAIHLIPSLELPQNRFKVAGIPRAYYYPDNQILGKIVIDLFPYEFKDKWYFVFPGHDIHAIYNLNYPMGIREAFPIIPNSDRHLNYTINPIYTDFPTPDVD